MNRTKSFMYNTFFTALYQVVIMAAGFITPKILLTYYGSELNGLVSSINQFINYFSLVEAGIAGAAVFSLYGPLAKNNHKQINAIIAAAKKYYIKSGIIFTLLILILALIYPLFVEVEQLSNMSVFILIFILGSKGFLDFFTLSKYRVLLTADQRTYVISIASSIYICIQMIIIYILSKLGCNIIFVYFIAIIALISRSLILILYVKKKYKYVNYNEQPDDTSLSQRWDALFLQILGATQTGTPVILVTIFCDLLQVSVYSIYNMILSGINGILSIFINGISASFGNIIAKNEKDNLKRVYSDFELSYYILISIVYSVSFVMIMSFINLYTNNISDVNYYIPILGFLFVLNGLLYNIKTPQGTMVIAAGLYKETKYRSLIQALIIIIFGCVLVPKYGIIGALIASCLSNLYRDIDLLIYISKNVTKTEILSSIKNIFILLMSVATVILISSRINMNINSYKIWIVYAIIWTIISCIITIIYSFIINKKQTIYIFERIKKW